MELGIRPIVARRMSSNVAVSARPGTLAGLGLDVEEQTLLDDDMAFLVGGVELDLGRVGRARAG